MLRLLETSLRSLKANFKKILKEVRLNYFQTDFLF